ncbi:MAG: LPS export ABC transporter permease LptF [Deltaproteobacteria bacterium]|nr:LPS export ABC transporter permease LptF [Deltaproteobacteria bacterium]MBW2594809.1 LPS export ABC transporter permease LptF [Deltaproteobacteria bacterium]MBW2649547.1 LPS export ABC transporter permease LptF [Deltaproteobacteria bacterium]
MNKVVNRYILKEISIPFFMIIFILTFALLMGRILQLMDLMINRGIYFADIAKLVLYLMPSLLIITIPVSLLISILMGMGRLSRDNEILVLKSSGLSLYQLMTPIAFVSLCAFLMTAATGFFLVPYGNLATRNLLFDIAKQKASIGIKERVFNDDFAGLVLYSEEIPSHGDYMKSVFISDTRMLEEPATIIAQKGYFISNPESMQITLRLEDGSIHTVSKDLTTYKKIDFSSYDINLDLSTSIGGKNRITAKDSKEMSLPELIRKSRAHGLKETAMKEFIIEIHKKFTLPFACIVFGIIGIPLGIAKHRSGKSRGFVIGLIVIMIYYVLQIGGEALGETGMLSPAIGAWISNVMLGVIGVYLLIAAAREKPLIPDSIRNIRVRTRI